MGRVYNASLTLSEKRAAAGRLGAAARWAHRRRDGNMPTRTPAPVANRPDDGGRSWYRLDSPKNRADGGPSYAELYIYDEIGYWGITAGALVAELGELDVDEIDLHINSPGGEVWDGIAIYNALRTHRARINVYVDAIAASIASVIAQAGDRRVMARNAQLMIHDGWGLCIGNAEDMREMADRLDRDSDNIASIYSDAAGGTTKQWRKAMLAETWYSASEAVTAGLADEVAALPDRQDDPDDTVVPDSGPPGMDRWDLSIFRYAGRDKAPAPQTARAADAESAPEEDVGELGAGANDATVDPFADLPDDTFAGLAAHLDDGLADAFEFDPATFATSVQDVYENAAAPPATPEPGPVPLTHIEIDEFVQAIQEALQP